MTPETLASDIRAGSRPALAKAITMAESTLAKDRSLAADTLRLLPQQASTIRLGISGPPGVGKSTFIDVLGMHLVGRGHRVAVLAVDPTSRRTGGSILGDKTRMPNLGQAPEAFIRPSPAGQTLGGVAANTAEAVVLCEAAGFNIVIVETVGVGQSETEVANLTDLLLLLVSPGGGDDLQGIKRGVMELADLVVVNKADGDLELTARTTAVDYGNALHLMKPRHPGLRAPVLLASALKGNGVEEVWEQVQDIHTWLAKEGLLKAQRGDQSVQRMWQAVRAGLLAGLPGASDEISDLEDGVRTGAIAPQAGAEAILNLKDSLR